MQHKWAHNTGPKMTQLETICKEPEWKDRQENGEIKFPSLSFF